MPKIKVVELYGSCDIDGDDIYGILVGTDWEEVDNESLEALKWWIQDQKYTGGKHIVIIEEKKPDLPKIVADYVAKAKTEKAKKDKSIQTQREKEARKQLTLQKKKEAKEKKLLEELKSKYDN